MRHIANVEKGSLNMNGTCPVVTLLYFKITNTVIGEDVNSGILRHVPVEETN
jgi:hypothetical protein